METVATELVSSQHILTEPDAPESENDVADATDHLHCLKCAAIKTTNNTYNKAYQRDECDYVGNVLVDIVLARYTYYNQ